MATVYPENTTYQTAGGGESVSARFPSLLKDIKSKIQNQSIQSVEQQRQRLARAATMFQPPQSGTSLRTDVASGSLTPPLSTQLAEGSKTETPIPSNYSGFYTGDSPESMTGVFPSDEAYIRSLPTSAGGGEYVVDPTQRGQLIKSIRGKDNAADILIRGGLSPLLYQIDHIVPLWAGGADTISNRQVIDVDTHRKKTRAQSVAYTLLANNKIGLNEAKQLALSWDTRDTSHIQDPDDNGFVDLRAAEDAYTRWKKETGPKPVTIRDIVKGIPAAMQKFGEGWLPGPIREFVKGGVSGLTAGWVPYEKAEYKPGVESTLSTIGGAAGQVAGTIYSFMKFAKLATKAASMAKDVGIKWLGRAPSASLATDIGTASIENVKRLANKERIGRILRDAGLFTVYGQLSRQEENTIESRMKRFFFDTAYGGMLGGAAKSISGYSTVAAGTFSLSLIEGEDAEDAALNAAIMTGLHGLGGTRAKKIEERLDEETSKAARGVLNKYLGDRIPTIKKGERYTDIDITPAEAETLYAQALNQLGKTYLSTNLSLEDLAKERAKIIVSLRQLVNRNLPPAERTKRATEDLQTTIGLLNSEVDALGYRTPPVLSKLLDDVPLRFPAQPVSTSVATPGETYAKGVIPVTGLAKDTVGESVTQNLIRFVDSVKAGTASNRVILVSRPEIEPIIRGVNNTMPEKDIKELRHRPSANPQNNVQVFAMLESPRGREYLPIGWLSRRFRIEDASTSFNKNFEKMVARIREKIKSNKSDPVKLQDELRKDKARIDIDEMDIPRVVEAATTMDDDALIAFLKPKSALIRFDSGFNKDTIAEEMRRKNLPFVTADIPADPPRWFETKAPESGEPVLVVNIEDKNWIETMELMKGGVKASAESRQIQGLLPASIRERQTSQNITATIKNIKNSFREDADVILANTEIPKMGPEKGIVEGMLSGFKNDLLTSKTPQEFKERINKIYGEVLDDTEASELLNNKESVRVKDVFNLLTDAHNAGKTNETFNVLHQKMLVDFFENRYFARSRLSGDFLEAPLISQKAVQQPLPSPVSTRTSVTRSPKVTTSKLEGLTPAEQAGVEQARKTGGIFVTARPPTSPPEALTDTTSKPAAITRTPLAERIVKTSVIRKSPSKEPPKQAAPTIKPIAPSPSIEKPMTIPSEVSYIPTKEPPTKVPDIYKGLIGTLQKVTPSSGADSQRLFPRKYEKMQEALQESRDTFDTRPEAGAAASEIKYQKEQLELSDEKLKELSKAKDPETKERIEEELLTIARRNEIKNPAVSSRIMTALLPTQKIPSRRIMTKEGGRDFEAEDRETEEALRLLGFSSPEARNVIAKQKSIFIQPVAETVKGIVQEGLKTGYAYGFNKTLDEAFNQLFGKNWGTSWVLNSYFTTATKKGNRFFKDLYQEWNSNLHYRSQYKPYVEVFVEERRKSPGGKLTPKQKEHIDSVTAQRVAELDEARLNRESLLQAALKPTSEAEGVLAQRELSSELGEEFGKTFDVEDILYGNLRIKDLPQLESDLLTDLTRMDEILMGSLYNEAVPGVELTAIDGAQDAIGFIATLVKQINRDRFGTKKPLLRFDAEKIEAPVRKELQKITEKKPLL